MTTVARSPGGGPMHDWPTGRGNAYSLHPKRAICLLGPQSLLVNLRARPRFVSMTTEQSTGGASGAADLRLRPIGVVRSPFTDKMSAPRQPAAARDVTGTIEL